MSPSTRRRGILVAEGAEGAAVPAGRTGSSGSIPDPGEVWPARASRWCTAHVLVGLGAVAVGPLMTALLRWRAERSTVVEFTSTYEYGMWTLMIGVQAGLWVVAGAILSCHLAGARSALRLLIGDSGRRRSIRNRGFAFALGALVALVLPSLAGLALGLESRSPLWGHQWKSMLITAVGLVAVLPGVLSLSAYREIAGEESAWQPSDSRSQVAWLTFLRERVRTVVVVLSLAIAMLIFVNSLLRLAMDAVPVTAGGLPSTLILAYAGLFSAVLASGYAYVRIPLRHRASAIIDRWIPLPDLADTDAATKVLDTRKELRAFLGLDRSIRAELEEVGLFALPILTALFSQVVGQGIGG